MLLATTLMARVPGGDAHELEKFHKVCLTQFYFHECLTYHRTIKVTLNFAV